MKQNTRWLRGLGDNALQDELTGKAPCPGASANLHVSLKMEGNFRVVKDYKR